MYKKQTNLGYLLIFLAGASWGTGGAWINQMTAMGATSFMTGFVGHFFALPILAVAILATRGTAGFRVSRKGLVFSLIMGIVTKGFFKMAYDTAIATVGVSTAAVLLYTSPVFVAVMSQLVFRERLRLNNYVALAMNLVGVFLMVTLGDLSNFNVAPLGIVLGLTAAFLHASNTIMAKLAGDTDDSMTMSFYMLTFSAITQGLVAQPWTDHNVALLTSGSFLVWAIINAVVTGAGANLMYMTGMSMGVDASKAPVVSSVEVIVASLLGVFLFGEAMNWVGIVGLVLMLASIYLMNREEIDHAVDQA